MKRTELEEERFVKEVLIELEEMGVECLCDFKMKKIKQIEYACLYVSEDLMILIFFDIEVDFRVMYTEEKGFKMLHHYEELMWPESYQSHRPLSNLLHKTDITGRATIKEDELKWMLSNVKRMLS